MGIKVNLMSLRMMLPLKCFRLIGGSQRRISCTQLPSQAPRQRKRRSKGAIIKLIKPDGGVNVYDRPVRASQLMNEFPKHMICHADSLYIGQKTQALSGNDRLKLGHNYFVLPTHFFQTVFTFTSFIQCQTQCPLLAKTALLNKAPTASRQPFFEIQKTSSGFLRIRVSDHVLSQLMEVAKITPKENEEVSLVCTTPQLKKDYEQLVGHRQWKPKLDTITERHRRKKISSSLVLKIRKKKSRSSHGKGK